MVFKLIALKSVDAEEDIAYFDTESVAIRYNDCLNYRPDIKIEYKNGLTKIIEVKSLYFWFKDVVNNSDKVRAAIKYCEDKKNTFELWIKDRDNDFIKYRNEEMLCLTRKN